jgi:hypothetical protein
MPLFGGWVDVCWAHDESLPKTRKERRKQTLPGCLFGVNVPHLKTYHTTRLCEATKFLQTVREAENSVLSKVEIRLCEALKLCWLFVAEVPTPKSSGKNRLCEAFAPYRLFVKSRTACFSKRRFGAEPWNPRTPLSHETQPKKESEKRDVIEKNKSLRLEI